MIGCSVCVFQPFILLFHLVIFSYFVLLSFISIRNYLISYPDTGCEWKKPRKTVSIKKWRTWAVYKLCWHLHISRFSRFLPDFLRTLVGHGSACSWYKTEKWFPAGQVTTPAVLFLAAVSWKSVRIHYCIWQSCRSRYYGYMFAINCKLHRFSWKLHFILHLTSFAVATVDANFWSPKFSTTGKLPGIF